MRTLWILGILSLLVVSVWSSTKVSQSKHFKLGSSVDLKCSNKTWSEMIYTIWNIELAGRKCRISFSDDGQDRNSCNDGKVMLNTSSGESYLRIPTFSNDDVGIYCCESVHRGGSNSANFDVSLVAPPRVSAWQEWKDNRRVAVCLAEGGKPAASIFWQDTSNSSSATTKTNPDGSYTVTSRLVLPKGVVTGNRTCVVTHPYWTVKKTETLQITAGVSLRIVIISMVCIVCIVVAVLGGLYIFLRHNSTRHCCGPNTTTQVEPKSPPVQEVEEVEPYASYVQRVNSIYNSSADLFR